MTERHRRQRIHDQRPPSRHMRSLLRQSFFALGVLVRRLRFAERLAYGEAAETLAALLLCRRALARDGVPACLAGPLAPPPDVTMALSLINRAKEALVAVDGAWDKRLIAAGIDPKWPDSGA